MKTTVDLYALRSTIEEHLQSRGVFDVDHYGWLNENDVDPDFRGYAMWALKPPYDHDFNGWQNDTPPVRAPTKAEQRLMELGHDFFGLMKTARHFIGYALVYQSAVQPIPVDPTDFDLNEFAALVALTAADDRLRDFVTVTTLGKKTNEKGELDKAYGMLRTSTLVMEADALQKGFKTIRKARAARNTAAHGLSTKPAHVERQVIDLERKAFEEKQWPNVGRQQVLHEDQIRESERTDADELKAVETSAGLLCDCYVELVTKGEITFRVEYEWRHLNNP